MTLSSAKYSYRKSSLLALDTKNPNWRHLDADGLPVIGSTLQPDEVLCCYLNTLTQEYKTVRYHKKEPAHVMSVTLVGDEDGKLPKSKAWIMFRIMVRELALEWT